LLFVTGLPRVAIKLIFTARIQPSWAADRQCSAIFLAE